MTALRLAAFATACALAGCAAHGLFPPPIAGQTWTTGTLQAGLSWSPDLWGRHAAEWQAALGQPRAAQAHAAAAANQLAAQVARGYIAVARLLAQQDAAAQIDTRRGRLRALAAERLDAGLDGAQELALADAAWAEARMQRARLDEQLGLARRQLAVLSGQAPLALDALATRLDALAQIDAPAAPGADLLGRRAEVVAARWRVEAAGQEARGARAQFYPNVNLAAFVGANALGLNRLFAAGSEQWGVAPALRLPLFDGQRLHAQLDARHAETDAAVAHYNATVLV